MNRKPSIPLVEAMGVEHKRSAAVLLFIQRTLGKISRRATVRMDEALVGYEQITARTLNALSNHFCPEVPEDPESAVTMNVAVTDGSDFPELYIRKTGPGTCSGRFSLKDGSLTHELGFSVDCESVEVDVDGSGFVPLLDMPTPQIAEAGSFFEAASTVLFMAVNRRSIDVTPQINTTPPF